MDIPSVLAILISMALAVNVGGNNAASAMGPSYGAGTRSRLQAALLIGVFSLLGAVLFGDKVVGTIGNGIAGSEVMEGNTLAAIVILLASGSVVALANRLRAPLATSHAMVGAVVGVGLFFGHVNWSGLAVIVAWWLVTPVFAFLASFVLGRFFYEKMRVRQLQSAFHDDSKRFRLLVLLSGCFLAFSAGSNSLAKAVGPLAGAGVVSGGGAAFVGGLGIALGAIFIGPRIIETVGKGITELDPLKALIIEFLSAAIVLTASGSGIPVSLAEIVTCSVVGFSCASMGFRVTSRNRHVKVISRLWPVSPMITAAASIGGLYALTWLSSAEARNVYLSLSSNPFS